MIASWQTIERLRPVTPFEYRTSAFGMTFGAGPAGYDIRIAETMELIPHQFRLGSSIEWFKMPNDLLGIVHDKSTWARLGLVVQNTVIEPGWEGHLTLELTNHGGGILLITSGMPIAQVIFHLLDEPTHKPYRGRYYMQGRGPQPSIFGDGA